MAELNGLESELAQRELDLATLHGELRAFEARYLRIVGVRLAELDKIEAQIAELQARLVPKGQEIKRSCGRGSVPEPMNLPRQLILTRKLQQRKSFRLQRI